MNLREASHNAKPYKPESSPEHLFPGSFYLTEVDEKYRRQYARAPLSAVKNGA